MNKNYYPLLTNGIQVLNTFQCDYCENAISSEPSKLSYFLKNSLLYSHKLNKLLRNTIVKNIHIKKNNDIIIIEKNKNFFVNTELYTLLQKLSLQDIINYEKSDDKRMIKELLNNVLIDDVSNIVFEYYNPLISEYKYCFHLKTIELLSRIRICLEHFRLDCIYRMPPLTNPITIHIDSLTEYIAHIIRKNFWNVYYDVIHSIHYERFIKKQRKTYPEFVAYWNNS